ncbi:MAG: type II toxin-antitoxin system VapC family toxin [Actinomycetota bacterium]
MTGYLLDTNVVSELRKRERAATSVLTWFDAHTSADLWLSVLTIGELRRGALLVARRDAAAGQAIGSWLESVIADFGDRLLPVSTPIVERWARLNVPDPVPVVDGLLAATALEHDLALVTRNAQDVASTGAVLVNPFEES